MRDLHGREAARCGYVNENPGRPFPVRLGLNFRFGALAVETSTRLRVHTRAVGMPAGTIPSIRAASITSEVSLTEAFGLHSL